MADALDLRHRLPRLNQRLYDGEVRISYARHVARKTRELAVEQAGVVDEAVAEVADGRVTWSRFEELVEAAIVRADPVGDAYEIKTHGGWDVQQPYPGIYIWRDPYGACYVVDHTGTRRVGAVA